MLLLDPVTTYFRDNPDYSAADAMAESEALFERQQAIQDMLDGKVHPDAVLDILSDQGFDVDEYIDVVCSNIDFITREGVLIEDLV